MQLVVFLSILCLVISQTWAWSGPEFKTSNPEFHRRKPPKVAVQDGYKLPGNARPLMYEVTLTLTPYDYLINGEVLITLDVDPSKTKDQTYKLQLNSAVNLDDMTFLWNEKTNCSLTEFGAAYIEITCPQPIEGKAQTLRITYTAHFASIDQYGMYTFYYKEDNNYLFMIATQLEQDYARRIFPCFDEPEYKAPIKLTLKTNTVDQGYDFSHWIANTKVASETRQDNVVTTTFETTPNMSAYLLAFVVTPDFQNFTNKDLKADYEFEIFARPSVGNYLSIALENGPKLIDLMGDFTGITYTTLGNNRMVFAAIPEFTAGAMENWGLITFREQILVDEGSATTARDKQYTIAVIAHELSHQWFGDYVTLDWWSETWLNEGFAEYFEYYLPNELYSDYDMARQFVVKVKQQALKTDSYPGSIPLSNNATNVTSDTDLKAEFGDISYEKGASIIKILHQTLGDDAFKNGLHLYLHNNNYSNPTAEILIDSLQTQVPKGQDLDLSKLFKEWIYESGYPLLYVSLGDNNKVTIQATKFSSSSDKSKENNTAIWWIPLTCATTDKPDFNTISFNWKYSANLSDFTVTLPNQKAWIIFNLQSIGYYRVNYDQKLWDNIISVLNDSKTYSTINVLNRAQLLDDIFNIAKSYQTKEDNGNLYYSTAFKLAEYLQYETEYHPWYTFFTEMQYLMEIIQDEETLSALKEKILNVVTPQLVIPTSKDKPKHTEILKRNLLLTWACKLGYEKCTEWAQEQFENYKNNTSSIDNNYRDVIVCTGLTLTNSSKNDFYAILKILENSNLPLEQIDLIKSLTCINKDSLIQELFKETIDYTPNQAKFSRMYNDKIVTTLYSSGFDKIKSALTFVLTYDNDITQYWQEIEDPETLFKKIATKIYNQKHIDMFNTYITKYEKDAEYSARIQAAKEAIEIANENIEYLDTYSAILKSVIVYGGNTAPTTTESPPETTTAGSSNVALSSILLASVFMYLLKYIFC